MAHGLDGKMDVFRVASIAKVNKVGKYNPYTITGNIIVNKAVVSALSSWILDSWVPPCWIGIIPYIYQALFVPGRLLYMVVGPTATDYLDLNNPRSSSEAFGYGLLACVTIAVANINIAKAIMPQCQS